MISLLAVGLTAFYIALMSYYTWGWQRLAVWEAKHSEELMTRVSVIVPARNEATQIKKCLAALEKQTYPKQNFEILVVDDHSTDQTAAQAEDTGIPNLKVIKLADIPGAGYSKKQAISAGIEQATGELIVTTDADCRVGPAWLEIWGAYYEAKHPKMMVGPVKFRKPAGLLGMFQQLDLLGMVGISGGSIQNGFPQVCNGANLAYEKRSFRAVNGFEGISERPTGDDVLLMQKMHAFFPGQVHFIKNPGSVVDTEPAPTWHELVQQRIRWGSKNRALYDKRVTFILLLVWLFNFSLLAHAVLVFFIPQLLPVFLIQMGSKLLADFVFFGFVLRFFREIKLLWLFLPTQLLHIIYIIFVGIAANLVGYSWRGRNISQ